MTTRVVHVNSQEWKDTPEDRRVYIGRAVPRRGFGASIFANPFKIEAGKTTREEAVDQYAEKCWHDIMADAPVNIEAFLALKTKCWAAGVRRKPVTATCWPGFAIARPRHTRDGLRRAMKCQCWIIGTETRTNVCAPVNSLTRQET